MPDNFSEHCFIFFRENVAIGRFHCSTWCALCGTYRWYFSKPLRKQNEDYGPLFQQNYCKQIDSVDFKCFIPIPDICYRRLYGDNFSPKHFFDTFKKLYGRILFVLRVAYAISCRFQKTAIRSRTLAPCKILLVRLENSYRIATMWKHLLL